MLILLAFAGTYMLTGVMDSVLESSWLFHLNNVVMGSIWVFVVLKMLGAWEKKGLPDLGIKVNKTDIYFLVASFLISLTFLMGFTAFQGAHNNLVRIRYENFWDVQYLMLLGGSCLGWAAAAFKEELLSRGFVLYQLRKVNVHKAVAVSAVLFMFLHFPTGGVNPYQAISWWLGGMLYAYAYVKSGSLIVSTGLHTIHNFLNELFIGRSSDFSAVILDHPVADVEKLLYELGLKGTLLVLVFVFYNRKFGMLPGGLR
ncbi:CPBP family intramembrane metalloprotease [Paenibacillus sp. TRM 82003]|nr:CPBP family intramembrane metalloprotease [Paenibacillus sp. TRM 82003]